MDLKPEYNLNFGDVDLFLHTISAEEEGIQAVKDILKQDDGEICSDKTGLMDVVFEKYLEEFIEANFTKINFGANLVFDCATYLQGPGYASKTNWS
jgi:hypothetical protein